MELRRAYPASILTQYFVVPSIVMHDTNEGMHLEGEEKTPVDHGLSRRSSSVTMLLRVELERKT